MKKIAVLGYHGDGGVGVTTRLLQKSLNSIGIECPFFPTNNPLPNIKEFDGVIFHGWFHARPRGEHSMHGLFTRDINNLNEIISLADRINIPVLVNGNWDDHPNCVNWIIHKTDQLSKIGKTWRWAVYSPWVIADPRLNKISRWIQPLPHHVNSIDIFARCDAVNVCIGEIGKLGRPKMVGDFSVQMAIDKIYSHLPKNANIIAYDRYSDKDTPNFFNVKIERPNPKHFLSWLQQFRVFVSLSRYESFNMVPAEAMGMGIPVMYRRMPQSLDSYIGFAGMGFSSIDELDLAFPEVYGSTKLRAAILRSGSYQSKVIDDTLVATTWLHALKGIKRKKMKPKICLVMIVKNEEHVIERCLSAVKPDIDCYAIMDTGSTDKTIEKINEVMEGIEGKIYELPFESFSFNRSRIMQSARDDFPDADYLLMIDADDTWHSPKNFTWPELTEDAYWVKYTMGGTTWKRNPLTKASAPFEYRGAAHEYLACKRPHTTGTLEGPEIHCGDDGHRRKTEGKDKYKRIAGILEKELEKEPGNRRNVFYLAQSWRDAGDPVKAIKYYTQRTEMGGWEEEVWNSKFEIAKILDRLGRPIEQVAEAYLDAYRYRPKRGGEALHHLAYAYRRRGDFAMSHMYAATASSIDKPDDLLFVNEQIYDWRALDEYCLAAIKLGFLRQARTAALELIGQRKLPSEHRQRVEDNFSFTCSRLSDSRLPDNPKVAVLLSTHNPDIRKLRKAIISVLNQTHANLELIVISDGNEAFPWEALKGIDDSRIKPFEIHEKAGQFKIYDAILRETDANLMAIQDDDGLSRRNRLDLLIQKMRITESDAVFSDIDIICHDESVRRSPVHPERIAMAPNDVARVGSHVGLWRTDSILEMGGYYGGFDTEADLAIVGFMSQLGRPAFLRTVTYIAQEKDQSMTTDGNADMSSPARVEAWKKINSLWKHAHESNSPSELRAFIKRYLEAFKQSSENLKITPAKR